MTRIDRRINLSFKNTPYEIELYNFVKENGNIMGDSAYLKTLIEKAMTENKKNKKQKE